MQGEIVSVFMLCGRYL